MLIHSSRTSCAWGVATVVVLTSLLACGGDSPTNTDEPPGGDPTATAAALVLAVFDADNHGDGRDIQVRFQAPASLAGISEFRVFLIPAADASAFDEAAAASAPASSFVATEAIGGQIDVSFSSAATATDGSPIVEGGTYAARVQSVANSSGITSTISNSVPVTLAVTNLVRTLTENIMAGTGGLDTDAEGNIYFADFGATLGGPPGTVVYKISPSGSVIRWATGLVGASGNAFGSNGDLFQSNISGGTVSRITPDGTVATFAGGLQGGPVGIAITPGDTLYVVNCGQNRIHKIAPDGQGSVWVADPLFNCPNGITLASDGNFYVANFNDGGVIRVTPSGNVSLLTSLPGGNNGHVLFGNGVLYVVARTANRIYEVTLDGVATVLAGTGQRGLQDGSALDATLSVTNDVALSPDGKLLYFNDVAVTTGATSVISPTVIRMVELVGAAQGSSGGRPR